MKKRIFNLLFLGAVAGMVSAQRLTVANVEILQGQKANFEITLEDVANNYTGLQFDMQFPTGFATTKNSELKASWNQGSISPGALKDGKGTVVCYTQDNQAFIPSGVFGTIEFSVEASVPVDEYDVTLSNITFFTSKTSTELSDVTFKVKVVDRLTIDENSTVAPAATTDKVNVHVVRTIKANHWSTICLPIALNLTKAQDAFGTDVLVGEFAGFTAKYADDADLTPDAIVLNFTKLDMNPKTGIIAGKPYLIKTSKDIESFDVDQVSINSTVTNVDKEETNYSTKGSFVGTLTKATVPADALFINDNKFWYSTGTRETKGLRGWFALGTVLDKETDFGSRVIINFIDDEVTGIKSMKTTDGEEIYTLSGQRVKNAGKGVYIVNGKKVIKK